MLVAIALDGRSVLAAPPEVEPPAAPIEVKVREGLLTLDARNAPLADILLTIGEKADFTVDIRGDLSTPVTVSFTDVPLDKVISWLIGNNSWVMIYGTSGSNSRALDPQELHVYAKRAQDTKTPATVQVTVTNENGAAPESSPASLEDSILNDLAGLDRDARMRAIGMLGRLKDENSIDILIQVLLEEEDPSIRQHAVIALGRIGGYRAIDTLEDVSLGDADAAVREAAASALARWDRGHP